MSEELLTELKGERDRILSELSEVEVKINEVKIRLAEEKFNVHVGSVIKNNGKQCRVFSIDPFCYPNVITVYANPKKKNGKFGIAVRSVFIAKPVGSV